MNENTLRDYFFDALEALREHEPKVFCRFLARFFKVPALEALDQEPFLGQTEYTVPGGAVDIYYESASFAGMIEVKLESAATEAQLLKYHRQLARHSAPYRSLVLLTLQQPNKQVRDLIETGKHCIQQQYWHLVGTEMESALQNSGNSQATTKVRLFLQRLLHFDQPIKQRRVRLMVPDRDNPLCQGLREHWLRIPEIDSPLLRRIRNFHALESFPELLPLHQLLEQMKQVVTQVRPEFRLVTDSAGKHNSGWIGYNLAEMQYFFFVYTMEPDVVYLETYRRKVPSQLPRESPAQLLQNDCDSDKKWSMNLSLSSENYFGQSVQQQEQTLVRFLDSALSRVVQDTEAWHQ